jgi:3-oxoacyl-[acyl-carrier protein] reductase
MNLGLSGKSCIVTGASRGIGACVGRELAIEGANVALVARSEDEIRTAADELRDAFDVKAVAVGSDLSTTEGAADAMRRAIEMLGGVDVLVNGAGASPFGSFDQITDDQWRSSFDLKMMGYVGCIRGVLPTMRERGSGRIVNIVGMAGRHATPGYVLGSLNAALLHLTKSLADLLAPDGVTVVAVNPGLTDTTRMQEAMEVWAEAAETDPQTFRERYKNTNIPLGRFATPEEMARTVVIMASEVTGYVTGSAIQVDGGAARGAF